MLQEQCTCKVCKLCTCNKHKCKHFIIGQDSNSKNHWDIKTEYQNKYKQPIVTEIPSNVSIPPQDLIPIRPRFSAISTYAATYQPFDLTISKLQHDEDKASYDLSRQRSQASSMSYGGQSMKPVPWPKGERTTESQEEYLASLRKQLQLRLLREKESRDPKLRPKTGESYYREAFKAYPIECYMPMKCPAEGLDHTCNECKNKIQKNKDNDDDDDDIKNEVNVEKIKINNNYSNNNNYTLKDG